MSARLQTALFRAALFLIYLAMLMACAPKTIIPQISAADAEREALHQMQMAITENMAMVQRLARVAFPVLSINAAACEDDATWYAGFNTAPLKFDNDIAKKAWVNLYGADDKLTVATVGPSSPAEKGGLQPRDKIILVNGEKESMFTTLMGRMTTWSEDDDKFLHLRILRGTEFITLQIEGVKACYAPVTINQTTDVNAFADGDRIYITKGMLKFVGNDDELALVIAHEMAHNTMKHSRSKMANRLLGALLDATLTVLTGVYSQTGAQLGAMAYSQEYEAEADYVGSYYAAKAGFDVSGAAELWRRMATAHPNAINLQGTTHPSTAKRFLMIKKAVEEIERKKANGRPLEPQMR